MGTALRPGSLVLAPATREAASGSRSRSALLAIRAPDGEALVSTFQILTDWSDPAGRIFLELHGEETTTKSRAERESIAWMLTHDEHGVFVTADKSAAITALAELGHTRVAHPFDLWIHLLEANAVSGQEFQALCERSHGKDQRLVRMPDRATRLFPGYTLD